MSRLAIGDRSARSAYLRPLAAVLAITAVTPAIAQDAVPATGALPAEAVEQRGGAAPDHVGLEEIVVTARKRDESLINVPVAVTALSATEINRYAAADLTKIGQLAPQVMISRAGGGGSGAVFAIRGISSSTTDTGLVSTVSVNIDGTQVSRGRVITQGFFDLQQVEVLKGPQALFFGKNSPGGVISLRSAGATDTLEAYARVGYEFKADEAILEAAVSGPISDTLGFRVAVRGSKMRGWVRNTAEPFALNTIPDFPTRGANHERLPRQRELLGRLTLEWKPTDDFSAILKVFGTKYKDSGPNSASETICTDRDAHPFVLDLTNFNSYEDTNSDCRVNGRKAHTTMNSELAPLFPHSDGGEPYLKYRSLLSSLTMNYDAGDVDLTSVTSLIRMKTDFFDHFDQTSMAVNWSWNGFKSNGFSQEFRARTDLDGPLNAMLGVYYDRENNPFDSHVVAAQQPIGLPIDPETGLYGSWQIAFRTKGKTYSAFGSIDYDLMENLVLSVGARYSHETRKQRSFNRFVNPLFTVIPLLPEDADPIESRVKNSNVSPEVTLTYHPTPNTTLYAAYKTGFKSGGIAQPAVLSPPPAVVADPRKLLTFKPEKVFGFEIGAKGQLLDNRLRVTAAAYRYKYKNLQVQTFNAETISFAIGNAASARTTGVEVDGAYQVNDALQLRAAAAYNLAKYLKYEDSPCYSGQTAVNILEDELAPDGLCGVTGARRRQNLSGKRLHRAPKLNLSGGFTYDMPVATGINLGFSGDANYSSNYVAQETQTPLAHQKSFVRLNATVRLHDEDDKWEVGLIGRNLTNKRIITAANDQAFGFPNQINVSVGRPREILLQGTLRY